jgi:hypothetical protein
MKIRKLNKIIRRLALGLAVAAIAAPVAQADPLSNDSSAGSAPPVPQTYGVGATLQDYLEFKGLPASAQYVYGVGATLQDYLEYKGTVGTPETIVLTDLPCAPSCPDGLLPAAVEPQTLVRPDDRLGPRDAGVANEPVYGRPAPAYNVKPVGTPQTVVGPDAPQDSPPQIVIQPRGFDWTDAGVGAGFAFGLVLLASGMALVARRHRETGTVAF